MAKLNIVKMGDEVLRMTSRPVEKITPRILQLLDDMLETMHEADGVGLAAPQVGILRRICVVEVEEGTVYEMINPKIVAFAGSQHEAEGCLSIPGRFDVTDRPMFVTMRATNRNGEEYEVRAEGLLARAFCHEIDHLDGVLFIDKLNKEGKKQ